MVKSSQELVRATGTILRGGNRNLYKGNIMNKTHSMIIKLVLLLTCSLPTVASALCYFNFAGCASSSCGFNCSTTSTGPNAYSCYVSMDQCCQCISWALYCNCSFGLPGYGVGSSWYIYNDSVCVNGKCSGANPIPVTQPGS